MQVSNFLPGTPGAILRQGLVPNGDPFLQTHQQPSKGETLDFATELSKLTNVLIPPTDQQQTTSTEIGFQAETAVIDRFDEGDTSAPIVAEVPSPSQTPGGRSNRPIDAGRMLDELASDADSLSKSLAAPRPAAVIKSVINPKLDIPQTLDIPPTTGPLVQPSVNQPEGNELVGKPKRLTVVFDSSRSLAVRESSSDEPKPSTPNGEFRLNLNLSETVIEPVARLKSSLSQNTHAPAVKPETGIESFNKTTPAISQNTVSPPPKQMKAVSNSVVHQKQSSRPDTDATIISKHETEFGLSSKPKSEIPQNTTPVVLGTANAVVESANPESPLSQNNDTRGSRQGDVVIVSSNTAKPTIPPSTEAAGPVRPETDVKSAATPKSPIPQVTDPPVSKPHDVVMAKPKSSMPQDSTPFSTQPKATIELAGKPNTSLPHDTNTAAFNRPEATAIHRRPLTPILQSTNSGQIPLSPTTHRSAQAHSPSGNSPQANDGRQTMLTSLMESKTEDLNVRLSETGKSTQPSQVKSPAAAPVLSRVDTLITNLPAKLVTEVTNRIDSADVQNFGSAPAISNLGANQSLPQANQTNFEAIATAQTNVSDQLSAAITSTRIETSNQDSRVEIELKPPELGKVSIEFVSRADELSVRIVTSTDATAQIVQDQLAALRESLKDAGIFVSDLYVDQDGSNSNQNQSLHRDNFQQPSDNAASTEQHVRPDAKVSPSTLNSRIDITV